MKTYLSIFSIVFLLLSCNDVSKKQSIDTTVQAKVTTKLIAQVKQNKAIDKPFKEFDEPFNSYHFKIESGKKIYLETGTFIDIPSLAFKHENGEVVEGDIEVKYREFHDIASIMLSGINMTIKENNETKDFESAGMFEIRAYQDGKPLELRDDKTIKVDLASYKSGNFNDYTFDDNSGNWTFHQESQAKPNRRKKQKLEAIDEAEVTLKTVCETAPRRLRKEEDYFDLDFNLSRHRELNLFNGALWVVNGDEKEKSRFKQIENNYETFDLIPEDSCGTYKLTLWHQNNMTQKNAKEQKEEFSVVPVWGGKQFETIKKNYREKIRVLKSKLVALKNRKIIAEKEADLVRSFTIKGMGIFNCDRVLDFLKLVPLAFVIKSKDYIQNWWYITNNGAIAIKYYASDLTAFKFNPNSRNKAICVTGTGKVIELSNKDFEVAYKNYVKNPQQDKVMEIYNDNGGEAIASAQGFKEKVLKP